MLQKEQLIFLVILVILVVAIILWLYSIIHIIHFQKRIENYVVRDDNLENISILDKLFNLINKVINNNVKKLKQSNITKVLYSSSKSYEIDTKLRIILIKMYTIISFLILYFILSIFKIVPFSFIMVILLIIFGFSLPNIILNIKKKVIRKQIENDLLKAISLISNSLSSGKSIIQAIETVSLELEGDIAIEFNKIYQDMLHGLSFQTAFNRFYERVDLEEVKYITSALVILNKTGGNIMEVFSSIEKNFYTRRKLDQELNQAIASSRLVFWILVILPIGLWTVISCFNPSYFQIFFESTLGILLFLIILCIYLIYIVVIRMIMKVEKY